MDKQPIRLSPVTRQRVMQMIANAPDGYFVVVSEPTRSYEQNALLHKLCSDTSKQAPWSGKLRTTVDWKRLFVDGFLRIEQQGGLPLVPSLDYAGVVPLGEPTRAMGVKRMTDLIDYIGSWCAENNIRMSAAPGYAELAP